MRGKTLANLVTLLKAEIGQVLSSDATGNDDVLKAKLAAQQEFLGAKYRWDFLTVEADVTLVAGTRLYSYPTRTDSGNATVENPCRDHEVKVETLSGGRWSCVEAGISGEQYNIVDSEAGTRLDPVTRWRMLYTGGALKIEVWPIPATAGTLRLTGQRTINRITANSDVADLDDQLIVYFAAAEILANLGQNDAQAKLAKAQDRLNTLRAAQPQPIERKTFVIGGGATIRGGGPKPTVAVNYTP